MILNGALRRLDITALLGHTHVSVLGKKRDETLVLRSHDRGAHAGRRECVRASQRSSRRCGRSTRRSSPDAANTANDGTLRHYRLLGIGNYRRLEMADVPDEGR